MLLHGNKFDKMQNRYKCDRCDAEITSLNRNAIYIMHGYDPMKKTWDLCPRCFRALERGINKNNKGDVKVGTSIEKKA